MVRIFSWWRSYLGYALCDQEKYAEAELLLLSSYEGFRKQADQVPPEHLEALLLNLVEFYEADVKRPEEAAKWKQKLEAFQQESSGSEKQTECQFLDEVIFELCGHALVISEKQNAPFCPKDFAPTGQPKRLSGKFIRKIGCYQAAVR